MKNSLHERYGLADGIKNKQQKHTKILVMWSSKNVAVFDHINRLCQK